MGIVVLYDLSFSLNEFGKIDLHVPAGICDGLDSVKDEDDSFLWFSSKVNNDAFLTNNLKTEKHSPRSRFKCNRNRKMLYKILKISGE